MDNNKIYSMIGLANKAGQVISGDELIRKAINKKNVKLIIIAQDSSDTSKEKYINLCKHNNIKMIEFGTKDLLGNYVGKANRAVVGIKDDGFKNAIIKKMNITEN